MSRLRTATGLILLLALVGGSLGACGGSEPEKSSDESPGTGTLVVFRKSGGIAGVDERLTVKRSGSATTTIRGGSRRTFTVSEETLRGLEDALEQADFASLRRSYPDPGVADAFEYRITYEGRTVRAVETVVPAALEAAVDILTRIGSQT